jgi:hypothetical protein
MEPDTTPARTLNAMALLASLRTAVDVCHALAERRAGRDPSEQEAPAAARRYLREARRELAALAAGLRAGLAVERAPEAVLVGAFEDRMRLVRAARELHVVHQRLLSLYPAVDEATVEAARRVQAEAARLATADEDGAFPYALAAWVEAAAVFLDALADASAPL